MRKQFILIAALLALVVSVLQADHFSHSVNVSALEFDGDGDWVIIPDHADLRMGVEDFTIEMWLNPQPEPAVIFFDKSTNGRIALRHQVGAGNEGVMRWQLSSASNTVEASSLVDVFTTGEWMHVAFTVDRGAATNTLYINGEPIRTISIAALGNDAIDPTSNLYLGSSATEGAEWTGIMDEVRIWKGVARTQEQINATKDKELIGNEAGLVGYWRFNEGSGITAEDDSGNNNDGTITGATYITDDLPHLQASQFHNLSPDDVIQPVAGEIPAMEQRDTAARQRNLPLMDVAADVEDRTGYPFVRLILAIFAGAFILVGAWFFSQLSPENPVPAWAFIIVASLLSFGFGALNWLSFIAIALYSTGIVSFSHRTPST